MTDELITLGALVEKSPDADFLREMIGFTGQHLMELWVESLTGAKHGERSPERINQSNGDRARESRVGRVELRIPKLKRGSYFPVLFLEPRRMAEKPSQRAAPNLLRVPSKSTYNSRSDVIDPREFPLV